MKKVRLTINNYSKCLCPVCPVQTKSECTAAKRKKWHESRLKVGEILAEFNSHPEAYDLPMNELEASPLGQKHNFKKPNSTEMMELYCTKISGGSTCKDLDGTNRCQCSDCKVWETHGLILTHYCLGLRARGVSLVSHPVRYLSPLLDQAGKKRITR